MPPWATRVGVAAQSRIEEIRDEEKLCFIVCPIFSHPPKQAHRRGPLRIASAERRVKPPARLLRCATSLRVTAPSAAAQMAGMAERLLAARSPHNMNDKGYYHSLKEPPPDPTRPTIPKPWFLSPKYPPECRPCPPSCGAEACRRGIGTRDKDGNGEHQSYHRRAFQYFHQIGPPFLFQQDAPPDLCSMGHLSCGFNARRKPSRKRRSQLQQTFDVLEENVDLLIVLGHFACQLFVGGQHLAWPHEGPGGLRVAGRSPIADLFSLCMLSCIYVRMRTCKIPKARTGSAQTPSQEYFHPWQSK